MATNILMPALSPTMTDGTLSKWHVKPGETVRSGDLIAEIETDKATMEVESVEDGIVGQILVPEGTEGVAVNAPIAILLNAGEDPASLPAQTSQAKAAPLASGKSADINPKMGPQKPTPASLPNALSAKTEAHRVVASPLARRLAQQNKIFLENIVGSGPRGRIVRRDIEAAVANLAHPMASGHQSAQGDTFLSGPRPAPTRVPHSSMRNVIARRLTEAKQTIPHFYVSMDVALDALLSLRADLNAVVPDDGGAALKISVNDMLIKAAALALKKVPGLNVSFTDKEMILHNTIDIAIAVSLPDGLITPILRNADRLTLKEISNETKALIRKAREGKLKPEEFQGGTFSISNMGMYGVRDFGAIINPPQAAILAVSAGEARAVVQDGALAIATVMTVTLSVDHRAVDGSLGAEWLKAFRHIVQNPLMLVI